MSRSLAALSLPFVMSGCCTNLLWTCDDGAAGLGAAEGAAAEHDAAGSPEAADDIDWDLLSVQVLLTPAAIAVDVITLPLQFLGHRLFWPDC